MKELFSLTIEIYKEKGLIVYAILIPLFIGIIATIYTHKIRYFFISISFVILLILGMMIDVYTSFRMDADILPFL